MERPSYTLPSATMPSTVASSDGMLSCPFFQNQCILFISTVKATDTGVGGAAALRGSRADGQVSTMLLRGPVKTPNASLTVSGAA